MRGISHRCKNMRYIQSPSWEFCNGKLEHTYIRYMIVRGRGQTDRTAIELIMWGSIRLAPIIISVFVCLMHSGDGLNHV